MIDGKIDSDFYSRHPELRPGEKFIGNYTEEQYNNLEWKTKRKGEKAYDRLGVLINFDKNDLHFPVFVEVDELLKRK